MRQVIVDAPGCYPLRIHDFGCHRTATPRLLWTTQGQVDANDHRRIHPAPSDRDLIRRRDGGAAMKPSRQATFIPLAFAACVASRSISGGDRQS